MSILDLVTTALATWYVAYAVTSTHGPFNVFDGLRKSVKHGGLLDCPICLAFWAALVLVTVQMQRIDLIQTLAVAGMAMIAHGWAGWRFGGG